MTRRATNAPKTGKDRSEGGKRVKTPNRKPRPLAPRPAPITWASARCEATGAGWHLALPVPVSANRIWRNGRGRTYEAAQHRADKDAIAKRFGRCGMLEGEVGVLVEWVRERRAGDVDNFCGKPLLDWLKGVLFADDKQVAELSMKRTDDPTRAPGLYVDVWTITNVRAA